MGVVKVFDKNMHAQIQLNKQYFMIRSIRKHSKNKLAIKRLPN
jgi:hypothetical protein